MVDKNTEGWLGVMEAIEKERDKRQKEFLKLFREQVHAGNEDACNIQVIAVSLYLDECKEREIPTKTFGGLKEGMQHRLIKDAVVMYDSYQRVQEILT